MSQQGLPGAPRGGVAESRSGRLEADPARKCGPAIEPRSALHKQVAARFQQSIPESPMLKSCPLFLLLFTSLGLEDSLAQSNDELVQAIADGKTQLI